MRFIEGVFSFRFSKRDSAASPELSLLFHRAAYRFGDDRLSDHQSESGICSDGSGEELSCRGNDYPPRGH